jgi:hypothetical protein
MVIRSRPPLGTAPWARHPGHGTLGERGRCNETAVDAAGKCISSGSGQTKQRRGAQELTPVDAAFGPLGFEDANMWMPHLLAHAPASPLVSASLDTVTQSVR